MIAFYAEMSDQWPGARLDDAITLTRYLLNYYFWLQELVAPIKFDDSLCREIAIRATARHRPVLPEWSA